MKKKAIALALSTALLILPVPPIANLPSVRADDSDIFSANVQPNVLILIDSSQSMNDQVPSSAYDPNTTYSGNFVPTPNQGTVYKYDTATRTYSVYQNSISLVPDATGNQKSAARDSLVSGGYWSGKIAGTTYYLFTGNYLNWKDPASTTTEPKIAIARRVITSVIQNTTGVRFGTAKFKSGGGEIISPIGSDTNTLVTGVKTFALTSVGTQLGEQLRDAGVYYKGQFGFPTPIQSECQPNFVIVVSDGLYTGSAKPQDEAAKLNAQDHSGLPGKQNIIVHTVGFGIGVSEPPGNVATANDELQQTAKRGGGKFYWTNSSKELEAALQDAIQQVAAATFAFATPVFPTTSATGSNRAYLASFQSEPSRPAWRGFLKAFNRGADGTVTVDPRTGVPLDVDPITGAPLLVWEAGDKLRKKAASSRTIYANIGGSLEDFRTSNGNITAGMLGVSTSSDRDKVVNYVRGIDSVDEDADGNVTEERDWKLGDIFHAAPVLVTPPFQPVPPVDPAPTYQEFKTANALRTTVLIASANDGMVHAVRESDGEELWAFIPNDLLASLQKLTVTSAEHPYFVDASPIAADVKIGNAWRTIVVFGERRGGRFYHALDITDTTTPRYLWSFTDPKMGETWSEPVIGKVKMDDGTERFVAIVGGGYDTASNNATGKAIFVIDLATGQKLFEYFNAPGAADDRKFMNFSLAANPTAVDLDGDGAIDGAYIADVAGQLWKLNLKGPAKVSGGLVTNWTGKRLFVADPKEKNPPPTGEYYPQQAIYGAPIPALDDQSILWIYFGTGDRNHPNNTTAPNRFFAIKDDPVDMTNGKPLTESDLVDVTTNDADATKSRGWFFRLGNNEKVLSSADVFNKVVFFSSFTPSNIAACGTGVGTAKLYAVQQLTGYAAVDFGLGGALITTNAAAARSKDIGTGIPSKPIIVISESGATISTSVIAATTSQQLPSNPAPPPSAMRKVLYWREVF
jgi:type IV pilus assembly protein PilY1